MSNNSQSGQATATTTNEQIQNIVLKQQPAEVYMTYNNRRSHFSDIITPTRLSSILPEQGHGSYIYYRTLFITL